ncbi:MAG TPA: AHH domain-containing protein [Myxococcaceae bacterium]|nr:AHH domain-containing protein [Myxococcaceae bacterium]
MSLRPSLAALVAALLLAACDESFESAPRVTPANESLWLLVGLQLKLDGIRPYLSQASSKSASPMRVDQLTNEVLSTCELLTSPALTDDELRAARYRVDLAAVAWGLLQADALASAGGIGGTAHATTLGGMGWINGAFENIRGDPLWPVKDPRDAERHMLMAVSHRDNLRKSIPASAFMTAGAHAAILTSGEIATVKLAGVGAGALARVLAFLGGTGEGSAVITAGFAGGVGAVQIVADGRSMVLTVEEVLALASAGAITANALAVFMAAEDLHHICTDKNYVSDKQGGPWTPRFEELFKRAGMSLQDPENLVRVKAHQGPHPRAYHEEVMKQIRLAIKGHTEGTPSYREALKRALADLAREIQTPGTVLNQLVTGASTE